ncbi:MAG: DUF1631 family protein [Candidatus Sedimenticola sp. (ex Thyasira tokunagai)]
MRKPAKTMPRKSVQSRYQKLVRECRELALVHLTDQLNTLFEQVEPTLIDFAQRAETNTAQARFFDAISIMTSHREEVEHDFRESISNGFDAFARGEHISYPTPIIGDDDSCELEMVEDEALEKHLAIQNMISKAQTDCHQQLYALGQRLAVIRGGEKLVRDDIPACPAHITTAYQLATDKLNIDKDLLLIIYLLFGKFVISELQGIYDSFNGKLIEAGLFPNLKLRPNKSAPYRGRQESRHAHSGLPPQNPNTNSDLPGSAGSVIPAQGFSGPQGVQGEGGTQSSGTLPLSEEIFNSIRTLMTIRRSESPELANHPEVKASADLSKLQEKPALISAIADIQSVANTALLPAEENDMGLSPDIKLDTDLIMRARETLAAERAGLYQTLDRDRIPTADLETIELVGMLFEEVLDEESLSNITKTLISHMHTPYLKAAIIDHRVLIDSEHIARQLLNLFVDAGRSWVDEEDLRRGIYYPMQESIHMIITSFQDDFGVFEEQFDIISGLVNQLEVRARVVEERNQEAARGREKLESARGRAYQIIEEHSSGYRLHPVVEHFLHHAWLDRMILMLLRDPEVEQGDEWAEVVGTIDQVLKAGKARSDGNNQEWLLSNLPKLKSKIEEGIASLGEYHQPDIYSLFKLLESAQEPNLPQDRIEPPPSKKPVIGVIKRRAKKQQPAKLSAKEQTIMDQLHEVKFGTWFHLQDETGKQHRLKLSWYSPVTNNYMFVDRFGTQALIFPIDTLIRQISRGEAATISIPELPFVDRAMISINTILKKALGL